MEVTRNSPDWKQSEVVQTRLRSLDDAMSEIQDGDTVVTAMAAAEPNGLFQRLHERALHLRGVTVYCANPGAEYPCFRDDRLCGHLEFHVMFLTAAVRRMQGRDLLHYTPQHLSRWVASMLRRRQVDVFWGTCSPPDERGLVSLGVGACYEPEVLRSAKKVVLEVSEKVPVTYGATALPVSRADVLIDYPQPLAQLSRVEPDAIDEIIGRRVAELVPDGATIQLGIGAIPNALARALATKKDLGVHTELINDAILELYQKGVITGRKKTLWPERIVGTFAYGSQDLYDFLDRNPIVELQPASIVNDPYRIGRNYRMTSINTAVEIDVTGQVCSESIGHTEISGVGGASDTHVGAQRSEGGRGILAMRSSTTRGDSKIVFELKRGAKVSISRNDVDTVVTEHGIAELIGRSTAERVRALVAIAPPQFREELLAQARQVGYL